MFHEKVKEFGSEGRNIDYFFFDGISNVQKAGQILCQTFPRSYCIHGGEHVLSIFFSDPSKLKQIFIVIMSATMTVVISLLMRICSK